MGASTTLCPEKPQEGVRSPEGVMGGVGGWKRILTIAVIMAVVFGSGFAVYTGIQNQVSFEVDGNLESHKTFKKTVGDALAEMGITADENVLVEPSIQEAISDGLIIKVRHAAPVRVTVDGRQVEVVTIPTTVGEILKKAGVSLNPQDRVEPGLDVTVDSQDVRITRVDEKVLENESEIPFSVEEKGDSTLERGVRRIVSRGSSGLERQRVKVMYEDGQEVKREILSKETIREPKAQLIALGTIDSVSRGGTNFRFKETMMMDTSAYTHTGGNTATGVPPRVGLVAVDPTVIPLGTRLYIEGYGFATAADIGSSIKGNRIDVFLDTQAECVRWGRRTAKVYIIE